MAAEDYICFDFSEHEMLREQEEAYGKRYYRAGDKCPVCGGRLVPRINREQQTPFMGCDRFPKCRGTRNIRRTHLEKLQQHKANYRAGKYQR